MRGGEWPRGDGTSTCRTTITASCLNTRPRTPDACSLPAFLRWGPTALARLNLGIDAPIVSRVFWQQVWVGLAEVDRPGSRTRQRSETRRACVTVLAPAR